MVHYIRSMQRKMKARPLYRQIIRESLAGAWREKRLWAIALFAGIVQTGGIYDVLVRKFQRTAEQATTFFSRWESGGALAREFANLPLVDKFGVVQSVLFSATIVFAILAFAILAQGALVYALDRHLNGKVATLRESLQRAAHRFAPLLVMNVALLGAIWATRFLVSAPLAEVLRNPTPATVALYVVTMVIFLVLAIFLTSLHLLSLNGMLVDELTLSESLQHSMRLFRTSWLAILETAFVMLVIGSIIFFGSIGISFLVNIPFLLFMRAALYFSFPQLFFLTNIISGFVLLAAFIFGGSYAITFQYATWNRLYRRINEGTAHAKIHRVISWIAGSRSSAER